MTSETHRDELLAILTQQSERQLTDNETRRISHLLLSDESLIDVYVDYLSIHSLLTWDAGCSPDVATPPETSPTLTLPPAGAPSQTQSRSASRRVAVAIAAIALVSTWLVLSWVSTDSEAIVSNDGPGNPVSRQNPDPVAPRDSDSIFEPLELQNPRTKDGLEAAVVITPPPEVQEDRLPSSFDDQLISDRIDELVNRGLADHEMEASPIATDAEWVRRVYLTVAGRIPGRDESATFLETTGDRRRDELIDHVLTTRERATNLAVVWTNLLVGRAPRRGVNRAKLYDYLRTSFAANVPWIDVVNDLITARGRSDQNGATNFLIAHLNNQATPATAVTARLFLGEQISCVQCHDHPFAKGVTQSSYWALNAFFKDTGRVAAETRKAVPAMKSSVWKLIDEKPVPGPKSRMTTFETRSGRIEAVLPKYDGRTVAADNVENRREVLAELLATDSERKVARAMVNRMWAHFFGYGFTVEVDDMGPHVPVSHPELLELLTEAFVKSDYDLKRLMRWIACSEAWQRSSEMVAGNAEDRPDHGQTPLFSRVYLQRMTPEQVYESVRVAIRSSASVPTQQTGAEAAKHRHQWVRQFARTYDTDENDESLEFDGTIAQAMVMMNDADVTQAIAQATQSIVLTSGRRVVPTEALQQVALAMLTRAPTEDETKAFRAHYRHLTQSSSPAAALPSAIEDMMWAYLNSSEFVLIH